MGDDNNTSIITTPTVFETTTTTTMSSITSTTTTPTTTTSPNLESHKPTARLNSLVKFHHKRAIDMSKDRKNSSSPLTTTAAVAAATTAATPSKSSSNNSRSICSSSSPTSYASNGKFDFRKPTTCNCKYDSKNKTFEIEKLRRDLAKCQNELREELEKRGQSSSTQTTSARERAKLLKEISDLSVSKKRLESALGSASAALKQKTHELQLAREACKQQIACTEKSANMEIKKLLELLKQKDHTLATLDRNQYSDRSVQLKLIQQQQLSLLQQQQQQQLSLLQQQQQQQQPQYKYPRKGEGTSFILLQEKLKISELQVSQLKDDNDILSNEKKSLENALDKLKSENESLTKEISESKLKVQELHDSLAKHLATSSSSSSSLSSSSSSTTTTTTTTSSTSSSSPSSSTTTTTISSSSSSPTLEILKTRAEKQKILIQKLKDELKKQKSLKKLNLDEELEKKTVRFMLPGATRPIINGRLAYKKDMQFLFYDASSDEDDDDDGGGGGSDDNDPVNGGDDDDDDGDNGDDDGGDLRDDDAKEFNGDERLITQVDRLKNEDDEEEEDDDDDNNDDDDNDDSGLSKSYDEDDEDDADEKKAGDDYDGGKSLEGGDDDDGGDGEEVKNGIESECTHANYKRLTKEHLSLQKSYTELAKLPLDWELEKESLQLAIIALEGKIQEYETKIERQTGELEDLKIKNEELEFQVLEFEGGDSEAMDKADLLADCALIHRNQQLQLQIDQLTKQLQQLKINIDDPDNDDDVVTIGAATSIASPSTATLITISSSSSSSPSSSPSPSFGYDDDTTEAITTIDDDGGDGGDDDDDDDDDGESVDSMPLDTATPAADVIESETAPPLQEQSQKTSTTTVLKGDSEIPDNPDHLKRIQILETRLASSKLREKQLLDQLALLCQEKTRLFRDFQKIENETETLESIFPTDISLIVHDDDNDDSGFVNYDLDNDDDGDDSDSCLSSSAILNEETNNNNNDDDNNSDNNKLANQSESKSLTSSKWKSPEMASLNSSDVRFSKYVQSMTGEDENEVLHQKVCKLEKDCEILKEIIEMDESIICDLQLRVEQLAGSEKNLTESVERLEGVEKSLKLNRDELFDENKKLKQELTRSKSQEELLQTQLSELKFDEDQAKKQLEQVVEDLKQTDLKLKKKTAEQEKDRQSWLSTVEKLEDRNGELESLVELLKRRNQNLQRLSEDTERKLIDSENQSRRLKQQADCMELQRDAFVCRIQNFEKERNILLEKSKNLVEKLEEKTSIIDLLNVEIGGLRARLEVDEEEITKWISKVEYGNDAQLILMQAIEELRKENESLSENCKGLERRIYNIQTKQKPDLSSVETQTSNNNTNKNNQTSDKALHKFFHNLNFNFHGNNNHSHHGNALQKSRSLVDLSLVNIMYDRHTQTLTAPMHIICPTPHNNNNNNNHLKYDADNKVPAMGALESTNSLIPLNRRYFSQSQSPINILSSPPIFKPTNESSGSKLGGLLLASRCNSASSHSSSTRAPSVDLHPSLLVAAPRK